MENTNVSEQGTLHMFVKPAEYSLKAYARRLKKVFGAISSEAKESPGYGLDPYYSLTTESFGEIQVSSDGLQYGDYVFEVEFMNVMQGEKEKLSEILRRMVTRKVEVAVTDSTKAIVTKYHLTTAGVDVRGIDNLNIENKRSCCPTCGSDNFDCISQPNMPNYITCNRCGYFGAI